MRHKYTKEFLEPLVKECTSWRQLILKLQLKETGGNYKNLQKRCKEFKINITHFTGQGWNKLGHPSFGNSGKSLQEKLVEGDTKISPSKIRIRLLKNGLKENKCECCGITEWNGQPITIQLHHIDGNRKNNKLENLQMLCPNCHSQTHNFCKRKELLKTKSTKLVAPEETLDVESP